MNENLEFTGEFRTKQIAASLMNPFKPVDSITTVARMFLKQIETGVFDERSKRSCEAVSDFMFLYGTHIYYANISMYASLLGFLSQAKIFNPNSTFYGVKDLDHTFNPQMN